jgi:predicted permease
MDTLLQDLRYAARKLARTPGFTAIAVLTLALAIGANSAIFSVIDGVILKPLPFFQPDRLTALPNSREGRGGRMPSSVPDFADYRTQSHSFSALAGLARGTTNVTGGSEPERVPSVRVSANFFSLMGVPPALGRGFANGEDAQGAARVAVISDALWTRRFARDPKIVGKTVSLDGEPFTVVGVAPATFTYPNQPDLWMPLVFTPEDLGEDSRGSHWIDVIGRLAPGVTLDRAQREMQTIAVRLEQQYPRTNTNMGAQVVPLQEYLVGDVRPQLFVMLGAVGFVLLIACANVANLLLVRAASRETEMAVRTALGAGRGRIVRQLITESVLLAAIGGLLGALLAAWGVDLLTMVAGDRVPRIHEVQLDGSALVFTAAIALGTGLLFGLIPALHAARASVSGMLREGGRGQSGGRGATRVRSTLVVTEMALSVVLLIGAGLLIRSFSNLLHVDPGFRAERVMTFDVSAPSTKYAQFHQLRTLATRITDAMKLVPGAQSSAIVYGLPLNEQTVRTSAHVVGTPQESPTERKIIDLSMVTPGYFATMGIPLRQGRDFTDQDRSGAPLVCIVNEEFVKRYMGGKSPLGQRLEVGWTQDTLAGTPPVTLGGEIVGVVGNVRRHGLSRDLYPEVHISYMQPTTSDYAVVVRSTADPAAVTAAVRAQMRMIDPDIPVQRVRQLTELIASSVQQPRFYMLLLATFAAVALVLAVVGIYGVVSYAVSQRTREIGIRIALGASRRQVVRTVLGHGLSLTTAGVVVGVAAAFWITRLLATLLFGVSPLDAVTFIGVTATLLGVATLACVVPARRAARVDPVTAMRAD